TFSAGTPPAPAASGGGGGSHHLCGAGTASDRLGLLGLGAPLALLLMLFSDKLKGGGGRGRLSWWWDSPGVGLLPGLFPVDPPRVGFPGSRSGTRARPRRRAGLAGAPRRAARDRESPALSCSGRSRSRRASGHRSDRARAPTLGRRRSSPATPV